MTKVSGHTRIVLMAGGKGERFWPRSTPDMPKQFIQLAGTKSLLRATFERAVSLVAPEFIYVVTGARYEEITREVLPELPVENLILEPAGRDTAPALGLAALWLERVDSNSIMIALPADHHVIGEGKFKSTVEAAIAASANGDLVTLGIRPVRPETGYGYIQVGDVVGEQRGLPVHRALRFVEKPDLTTAGQYLDSGDYLWNSGIFVWRVDALRREIARHLPALHIVLAEIAAAEHFPPLSATIAAAFNRAPKVSIDYGIMEKSTRVCVLPAYFGWDDVGNWAAVERVRPRDGHGNCVQGNVVTHDTHNVIIDGGVRLVATVGVSDLIVVDTDAALLICAKSRAQDVKKVASLAAPSAHLAAVQAPLTAPEGQVVERPWGREIVWALTDQYVSNVLEVKAGRGFSLQCNPITIFVQLGKGRLRVADTWHDLMPGKVTTITPGVEHELAAITDLSVIAVSSPTPSISRVHAAATSPSRSRRA